MGIAPKFNAMIDADISRFMKKAVTVDKKILDFASGVIIDIDLNLSEFRRAALEAEETISNLSNDVDINILGDTSDLERAIAEAHAHIGSLNNDSTININGNNSNFDQAVSDVNRQTNKLSRRITEARIGANIGSFESRMVEVARSLAEAGETVTPQIELELNEFTRDILSVQDRMREIARTTADPQVEADIAGFMAQMALVQGQLDVVTREHDVDIRVDAAGASARLSALWLQLRAFTARDFVINLRASWQNYQAVMGAMATFSRNFGEILGMVGGGIKIMMSPAIVPVLASVVGLLGNLGPLLGTVMGSTFALATSFGAAGIGAAGFAAVAVPSIGKVIETSGELKDIEEKLAAADTWKERNKLMKEQTAILNGMSKEQVAAGDALNAFQSNYQGLVKDMEKPVLDVFASGLGAVTGILNLARPMIENVTGSIKKMMDGLNANLKADDVKGFFNFLADFAGPALETVGSAVGNFVMGLFNMMAAFGPLATETQNSFLKMSESFRSWSGGLSENKGFQKFSAYVSENMPKIRSIFSDAINGVIHMFSAFGDSSSGMMTKLEGMMEGFLNWSKALGESEGFKGFIDYVQTNGPVLVSTIGNIVDTIIELGIAAAPLGEKFLGVIEAVSGFTAKMLEAHPWLGKLAVGMIVVSGAFLAAFPILVGLNALLSGFILKMVIATARVVASAVVMVAKWVLMGVTATINAAKVVAGWVLIGIQGTISAAKAVASAVIVVAQWVLMGVQAGLHAIKVAAAWALSTGIAMITAVASTTASVVLIIAQWLLMGAQALLHGAKVAAAWLLTTGAAMVTAVASMAATAAVFVAKWTLMAVQSLAQAARMAAAWLIAMGPIGWAIAAVVGLAAIIILNWDKISEWTSKTWSKVSEWISTKWSEITSKTSEAASKMWNTVKEKFTSIVDSVKEKMSSAKEALSAKWEEIKSKTSEAAANILNTVKEKFTSIVNSVKEKMASAKETLVSKWEEMKSATISKIADMVSTVMTKFAEIVTKVTTKMSEAKTALSNKWEEAKSATSTKLATLVSTVLTFFSQVVSKVREKMSEAVRVLGEKVGEMPGKVLSFAGKMLSAGSDLVRGLINGIKNMGGAAIEAVAGVVGGVIGKAKSLLKINSPSRVFSEFGGFVSEGLANGVSDKAKLAVDNVSRMASDMSNAFNPNFATQSVNMEMNRMDYGSELDSLSAQVKRELSVDMNVKHSGSSGGGDSASTESMFAGANFYVRSDDDINKLAKQLERHRQQGKRKVRP